jgi:hypothetical protein
LRAETPFAATEFLFVYRREAERAPPLIPAVRWIPAVRALVCVQWNFAMLTIARRPWDGVPPMLHEAGGTFIVRNGEQ